MVSIKEMKRLRKKRRYSLNRIYIWATLIVVAVFLGVALLWPHVEEEQRESLYEKCRAIRINMDCEKLRKISPLEKK